MPPYPSKVLPSLLGGSVVASLRVALPGVGDQGVTPQWTPSHAVGGAMPGHLGVMMHHSNPIFLGGAALTRNISMWFVFCNVYSALK